MLFLDQVIRKELDEVTDRPKGLAMRWCVVPDGGCIIIIIQNTYIIHDRWITVCMEKPYVGYMATDELVSGCTPYSVWKTRWK